MSFCGTFDDAKNYAKRADMQIDGLETSNTSPVRDGSTEPGGAPMSGRKEFTPERTRIGGASNPGGYRREFPTEGVTKK